MQEDPESAIGFVLALGRTLHRYGTPAHRLEESLKRVCDRLGLEAEVFTTPTAIIISFGRPTELRTRMMRVEASLRDVGKLAQVDALVDEVVERKVSPADGSERLSAIIAAPSEFPRPLWTFVHGTTAASIAVFLGGSIADTAVAGVLGLVVGVLAQVFWKSPERLRIQELAGSSIVAFAAGVASSIWPTVSPSLTTTAAIAVLLPGFTLTVAMNELATRNLIAGTARLMSAVIILLELVIGVAVGERLAEAVVLVHKMAPVALPDAAHWIAVVAAALGVAIIAQAPQRAFGWILAACVTAYAGSRAGNAWLGPQMGVLVGAFSLGVMSNAYARWRRRPAQVIEVPAVLMLVPGSIGFSGMAALLDRDTLSGVETLFAMFVVAIAIVAGLLVATALMHPRRSL